MILALPCSCVLRAVNREERSGSFRSKWQLITHPDIYDFFLETISKIFHSWNSSFQYDIADNEAAQVKITQTGNSTDVIERSEDCTGDPAIDTYDVVLTACPTGTVRVRVTPEMTKSSAGRVIHWSNGT
jgi:hypothetical protein